MTTDIANTYQRTQVLTANPEQLRLLLLEAAVRFARQGAEAIHARNHEGIYTGFTKSRDIVVELMTSIRGDVDATLRTRIQGLYMFIFRQLVDASFERDLAKADKAIELLEYEVETWKLAMAKASEERSGSTPAPIVSQPAPTAELAARPALSLQG